MRLHNAAAMLVLTVVTLSRSFVSPAESAPCSAGTIAMEVGSATELQIMINALNCTGEGTFDVTWIGRLQLLQNIELSDSKNLSVTGSSSSLAGLQGAVIDAANTNGIFSVSRGSILSLNNMVLNGGASEFGGAVEARSSSSVHLVGCSLTNNNASVGGAISAHSSEVHIGGQTSFSHNMAQKQGGAIYANESQVHLEGQTSFTFNSANYDGGAIFTTQTTMHINGVSTFTNNSAGGSGGALYAEFTRLEVSGNTSFERNTADVHAGAFYFKHAPLQLVGDTYCSHNFASKSGGVFFFNNASVEFSGTNNFHHNSAVLEDADAGVIYAENGAEIHCYGQSSFVNNSAGRPGEHLQTRSDDTDGYIHMECKDPVQFRVCNGRNGYVGFNVFNGGGGCNDGEAASLIQYFVQTLALPYCSLRSVFHVWDSEIYFDNHTSFLDNSAGRSGGVGSTRTSGVTFAGETNFTHNYAALDGGVLVLIASSRLNISGVTSILDNSAETNGGGFYTTADTALYIDGKTSFTRNTAGGNGGALCSFTETSGHIAGITTFRENVAKWLGGAMFSSTSEYKLDGITSFLDNSAYDGGAYVARDSEVYIDGHANFSGNSASHDGGAINMLGSNAIILGEVEVSSNTALNGGGIFAIVCPVVHVLGTTSFIRNSAVLVGGAISITDAADVHVIDTSFFSNEAGSGGAVSLASTVGTTGGFERCAFDSNSADNGGALHTTSGNAGDTGAINFVRDSVFHNNLAHGSGGALFNIGPLEIKHTVFSQNTAAEGGLAAMNQESPLELWNVTFHGNKLTCNADEYNDFNHDNAGDCRFDVVCERCFDGCEVNTSISTITTGMIPSCEVVPPGVSASATTTLAMFDLLPGYFRISSSSREILECYRRNSCIGGVDPLGYCATGYTGPYCAVCAENYTPGILRRCHKCSTANRQLAIGLASAVLVFASLAAVWLVPRPVHEGGNDSRVRIRHAIASGYNFTVKALPMSAIKIVVVVLQIITQFTDIAGAVFPEEYEEFLSKTIPDSLDIGAMLQNFCIVTTDFYDRLLIATLGPIVVLSVVFAVPYVLEKSKRSAAIVEPMVSAKLKPLSAGLFFLFFVYSSVSFTIFQTFVCEDLDDGNAYLRADYSIVCWSKTHDLYRTYAGVMIFVYPVGIPALYGWWLVRNRRSLKGADRETVAHLQPFRGLWAAYNPSSYFYEVVECCRRIVLTGAAVFILPNSTDQIAIVLILAVIFMFVSESLSPFEIKYDMWLYRWGNGSILGSMYVALLMKIELTGAESKTSTAITAMLIAANAFMLFTVVVQAALLVKRIYLARRIRAVQSAPSTFVHAL